MPAVGFLRSSPAAPFAHIVAAFRQGLSEGGFVEGQNVVIEQRWADNQADRLPALAADLVRRQVAVIVGNGIAVEAARAMTTTIPILFVVGDDPVRMGLVGSLNRPEGNVTGVTFFGGGQLAAKRLELLRELVPKVAVVAVLSDPDNPGFEAGRADLEAAAGALGMQVVIVQTAGAQGLEAAFDRIVATGAGGLLLGGGPVLRSQRRRVVDLANRHRLPTIYELRDYVEAGGLISYSASLTAAYRQAGVYAGRILSGAKPSELPVLRPTTFELAVNLKTAKALGLDVPLTLLTRADEVIE
jgi:putative ABC transport system substrate-binding protein